MLADGPTVAIVEMPSCLVVADDAELRDLVITALGADFQLFTAANVPAARSWWRERQSDLVIVDRQLPPLSDSDWLQQLTDGHGDDAIFISLLAAETDPSARLAQLEAGADDYLVKPFDARELQLRCRRLVEVTRRRQGLERTVATLHAEASAAQASLTASEARFQKVVDAIHDYALYMLDCDGFVTSWNSGAESLTGFSEVEAIGRHYAQVCKPVTDYLRANEELEKARLEGSAESSGERLRKDGSTFIAQYTLSRIGADANEPLGYVKIIRDITAADRAARALAASEAKFRTIVDAVPQMIWSTRPDGFHDYYNKQWYNYTGVPMGSTDGKHWEDLFHPDDQPRAWRLWRQSLDSGEPYEVYYRLRHHSGIYRWTLGRANPLRDDDGEIVRWMGTCTDIHEQKQLEQAIATQSRRKDEYLAMLAHELRNPLGPLANSAAILRFAVADGDACSGLALQVIERQIRHMSRLIDDLLDVARLSRNKIELNQAPYELTELCRQAFDDYHSYFDENGVNAELELPAEPLWVMGDGIRITQVIGNLLHNAAKFSESGGRVRAVLRRATNKAVFDVTDSGIGIEPDLLVQLFDPFVQAHQGLARSKGGLGLGLALARGFAELHGGSLTAASGGLGKGAIFTLVLPAMAAPPPAARMAVATLAKPLSVVVIDDNRDMALSLRQLLELEQHRVAVAFDGISGLALIEQQRPQTVICDIGLPNGMDGYAVARAVRERSELNNIALIALSGYGQPEDVAAAYAAGFDLHLLKPVGLGDLRAALANAVSASA